MEASFMRISVLFPILGIVFYLAIIICIIYIIYRWVNKIITLKQEHNDLLREIIKKMDVK
jgi:flagellar biogenesis protein FliO